LTATPGTTNVDGKFKDTVCGNLTLTSTGIKGFTGTNGTKKSVGKMKKYSNMLSEEADFLWSNLW
jgi:hypothetical protein